MPPRLNLLGHISGRLLVTGEPITRRGKNGVVRVFWPCVCDCGTETFIWSSALYKKQTLSCGCLQKEAVAAQGKRNFKGERVASTNSLFSKYGARAAKKGLQFLLTSEEFKKLLFQSCYYCGDTPKNVWSKFGSPEKMLYNGIDRVNSELGYESKNVVSCCGACNAAKSDLDIATFFAMIKKIYERHINAIN